MQNRQPDFDNDSSQTNNIQSQHRATKKFYWQQLAKYLSLILLGAAIPISGNYVLSRNPLSAQPANSQEAVAPSSATTVASLPATTETNFVTAVVDKVGPAVVRINSSRTVTTQVPEVFKDPFFRDFFGSQLPQQPEKQVERGTGSGFIISADGRILTNAHVVDGVNTTVSVILKDGRKYQGKVLGKDPVTDVAVVKIEANNLPTVALGNSERLKPGEWAIAIGNPLGLDNTVTTGIISATGRSSSAITGDPDKRVSFIQTDAAINPGNSGGPLLNARGEVIGMNTAILQGAQGLGFAIPINTAQRISQQLIAKGKVEHAYLGIQMAELTPELKQNINSDPNSGLTVDEDSGVLVIKVMPNSPAGKAGLRAGDVIHQIDGQAVKNADAVQQAVENSSVGQQMRIGLHRNGQNISLAVRPEALAAKPE